MQYATQPLAQISSNLEVHSKQCPLRADVCFLCEQVPINPQSSPARHRMNVAKVEPNDENGQLLEEQKADSAAPEPTQKDSVGHQIYAGGIILLWFMCAVTLSNALKWLFKKLSLFHR